MDKASTEKEGNTKSTQNPLQDEKRKTQAQLTRLLTRIQETQDGINKTVQIMEDDVRCVQEDFDNMKLMVRGYTSSSNHRWDGDHNATFHGFEVKALFETLVKLATLEKVQEAVKKRRDGLVADWRESELPDRHIIAAADRACTLAYGKARFVYRAMKEMQRKFPEEEAMKWIEERIKRKAEKRFNKLKKEWQR
ncbi:hypothetical protein D6D23_03786 [Aureobasidium pullulans]|uniref:Uncharacterized protein n=2 Tax=Aureobasidium pullulans TaxID=5580 RepID=A0A074XNI9_AURPU|nr:uncharacterized protein M438DRAFT_363212 [Aureobasidium pullulans EXF-150]THV69984.1 hypothetical protein D6D28_05474 [Aureobasidium pullulans]KEQ87093.1 hypothetical protein M438DRAFT_363212 [Aureobasidium pullulans EXF-150]THW26073.1 hypothetical protein D6D23_03786 [Aureobasidium pullulans]THY81495.1 hypothetical protein D6C92_10351 [Aureobasidium pullulans]THZ75118.1 hypothetical protein D6C85_03054 [Aureobasidium pullulans]